MPCILLAAHQHIGEIGQWAQSAPERVPLTDFSDVLFASGCQQPCLIMSYIDQFGREISGKHFLASLGVEHTAYR